MSLPRNVSSNRPAIAVPSPYWRGGLAVLLVAFASAGSFAAELQTLSGKKITGDVAELTSQAVVIRTAEGEVRTPIADVLLLEIGPDIIPKEPATGVELTDGT